MKKATGVRGRWLTVGMTTVSAVALLLAILGIVLVSHYYYNSIADGLEIELRTSAEFFENYIGRTEEDYISGAEEYARSFPLRDSIELQMLDVDGNILVTSFDGEGTGTVLTEETREALASGELCTYRGKAEDTREHILSATAVVCAPGGEIMGAMRMITSLKLADRNIGIWSAVLLGLAMLIIAVTFVTGSYFVHMLVAPIVEITETTGRIASGGYGTQIQRKFAANDDEIGALARSINNLSLQISQTEKMQSEFLSSVSHELRTPLTAISGWGETLIGSEEMDPKETRRGIVTMLKETKRLTSLVEELLEFSRIQDGRFKLNVEDCDLRGVFEDTIFMYGNRLQQDGIQLEYEDNDQDIPEIRCDPERMKQVFLNILDNAAKYGGSGGKILCDIQLEEDYLAVRIRDYGSGIPEEELPLVKKKFYKGSTSNARGSGIGLAVCEEIVAMHGGELMIANAADEMGGCEVTIRMPL